MADGIISRIQLPNGNIYDIDGLDTELTNAEIDEATNTEAGSGTVVVSGVTGVKGNAEMTYRTGEVNLTPANIGAQPALVSGTNIKTINNQSLLGSGNISISGGGGDNSWTLLTSAFDESYGDISASENGQILIVRFASFDYYAYQSDLGYFLPSFIYSKVFDDAGEISGCAVTDDGEVIVLRYYPGDNSLEAAPTPSSTAITGSLMIPITGHPVYSGSND